MKRLTLIPIIALLSGCSSNPLAGLMTFEDAKVAPNAPASAIAETPEVTEATTDTVVEAVLAEVQDDEPPTLSGLFSGFFGAAEEDAPTTDEGTAVVDTDAANPVSSDATVVASAEGESESAAPETPPTEPTAAPRQAGFFASLFGSRTEADEQAAEETPTPVSNSGGLSGLLAPSPPQPTGPDARRVEMNVLLPFGEVATNCEVSRRQLGTKVDEDSGYTLYDTIPNATALRTHYITGFSDRCARQFTAATALLGDIGTHEVVRYLPSNRSRSYSETDNAYEELKASYCGAARGQPCGGRLDRFARRTVFVSGYKRFSSSPEWVNILLHDGRVVAVGAK